MRAIRFALLTLLLAAPGAALADTLAVPPATQFVYVYDAGNDGNYSVSDTSVGGVGTHSGVGAGLFDLQARNSTNTLNILYTNVAQAAAGTIASFCIDLKETIGGSPTEYQVVTLDTAPRYSAGNGGTSGEMGSTKATEIEKLWAKYIDTGVNPGFIDHTSQNYHTNDAFQLAAWEIEYETDTSVPLSLSSGKFTGSSAPGGASTITEANNMLAWLLTPAANQANTPLANLYALSAPTGSDPNVAQDQIIEVYGPGAPPAPEPATIFSLATMFAATACGSWKQILKRLQSLASH